MAAAAEAFGDTRHVQITFGAQTGAINAWFEFFQKSNAFDFAR